MTYMLLKKDGKDQYVIAVNNVGVDFVVPEGWVLQQEIVTESEARAAIKAARAL